MWQTVRALGIVTVLLGVLFAAGAARADNASDQAAIVAVIQSQLDAFQRDDGAAAFSHAAPGIRARFGSADNFMAMVRGGYSSVYRPQSVEFLDLITYQGVPAQRVLFVGPDGEPVIAIYPMEQQADGSWRIAGCILERVPSEAA
ncbi:MAG: DUF4864 domain-containing protein [Pseudomonadota bacterium]